jgi:16S rRNA (adenine(1408)-N(1))-methyltransferase
MDSNELHARLASHQRILLDLGTGDGKFAFHYARAFPSHFIIGVDSCRENLRKFSRAKLTNLLYVIASAQELPRELNGLISHITVNFPWGSLLKSLLSNDPNLMFRLSSISRVNAGIDVSLNSGALAEASMTLEHGTKTIRNNLLQAGWQIKSPISMDTYTLGLFPSTWAKRLAYGRDPRAIAMSGCR